MKIKYSRGRLIAGLIVLSVLGLICYGFFISLHAAGNEVKQSALDNPRAFFQQQTALGTNPADTAECLQLAMLDRDVESFRTSAAKASDIGTMTTLPGVAPGALQELGKGQISAKFPVLWPYVMAGSCSVIGNSLADEPVVAFYNPYFDVVLLTKWTFRD